MEDVPVEVVGKREEKSTIRLKSVKDIKPKESKIAYKG